MGNFALDDVLENVEEARNLALRSGSSCRDLISDPSCVPSFSKPSCRGYRTLLNQIQVLFLEISLQFIRKSKLAVSRLPQKEFTEAPLARGADDYVWAWSIRRAPATRSSPTFPEPS